MISVIMPTYNTPREFLENAIQSILRQTYGDFEFIIVDDCSTDDTEEYLRSIADSRIRVIRNQTNLGITKSLNIGLREARGEYIARMDSDDIALPERFEKQLKFMQEHQNVIVCGDLNVAHQPIDLKNPKTNTKNAGFTLEERMGCGIGACLGCVCKTTKKDHHSHVNNARICTDGPVFLAEDVDI